MSRSDPFQSSSDERIAEIGALLAAGLMRLRAAKSSAIGGKFGESSLHISPGQSSHVAEMDGESA